MQHRGFIQEEYAQQACLLSIYVSIPTPQSSDLQFPDLLHPVPPTFCFFFFFFFTPQTLLQSSAAAAVPCNRNQTNQSQTPPDLE
jgi:hypothetical protein